MSWEIEYEMALKSGMFWEWFPELSGEWEKDEEEFVEQLKKFRKTGAPEAGAGGKPSKGFFIDPLDGITPEMFEALKPKVFWYDVPIIPGTAGADPYVIDEVGRYGSGAQKDLFMGHWHYQGKPKGWIQLEIYHAEGYFVGEWRLEPETSGRRTLTKTGWKGVRDFVAKHNPEDFAVTYNGVKIENNVELFKKLFEEDFNGH